METKHEILFLDSGRKKPAPDESIDLVVTSPPYPMIQMWDDCFIQQDTTIDSALKTDGHAAFEKMHQILDRVWANLFDLVKPGGFVCINIGDAVRTINANFAIYPNHARILNAMTRIGFTALPYLIWRKQTNAPNKFMGSGMLPAGAYVTLEHEYILVFRKGSKREFKTEPEKKNRRQSALFWEERNAFFSDVWFDIKGSRQNIRDKKTRMRSGVFPFEIPFRLICMYSVKNDVVLDPFAGMGTTLGAAMALGRSSIGCEIDPGFSRALADISQSIKSDTNTRIEQRLSRHMNFVNDRMLRGLPMKHKNIHYDFPVITSQEKELVFNKITDVDLEDNNTVRVSYSRPETRSL